MYVGHKISNGMPLVRDKHICPNAVDDDSGHVEVGTVDFVYCWILRSSAKTPARQRVLRFILARSFSKIFIAGNNYSAESSGDFVGSGCGRHSAHKFDY